MRPNRRGRTGIRGTFSCTACSFQRKPRRPDRHSLNGPDDALWSKMMKKNVYVLGLLDWQRDELETIRDADLCRFHSLLTNAELMDHEAGFDELLKCARRQLNESDKPDAIVCHWDFPSSCLA